MSVGGQTWHNDDKTAPLQSACQIDNNDIFNAAANFQRAATSLHELNHIGMSHPKSRPDMLEVSKTW